MEYQEQLDKLEAYFRNGEERIGTEALGLEVEHFVVDEETLKTVSYSKEGGIEDILSQLVARGWQGKKEGEFLVQASKGDKIVTLEPGGQLEVSLEPQREIVELQTRYYDFLSELIPILNKNEQLLVATGYQIESKISEIEWNPKRRYEIMSNYLAKKGKYAHNMMKGSASIQITVDYINEEDFIKKFRIANALAPVIAVLFDNAAYFEGEEYNKHTIRTDIWSNCDPERSGTIKEAFEDDFGYRKYAEYILNRSPILLNKGSKFVATGDKTCREIFITEELGKQEIEHILTMFFPDVRLKDFIEIRMIDSLPPELIFTAIAFWKGLLYDPNNLEEVYAVVKELTYEDVIQVRKDVVKYGLQAKLGDYKVLELGKKLIQIARTGLSDLEKEYLTSIERLITEGKNPVTKTKEKLQKGCSKREALEWLILNNKVEE